MMMKVFFVRRYFFFFNFQHFLAFFFRQVRLLARDGQVPSLTSTATVLVRVNRNPSAPVFTHGTFNKVINYNDPPGTFIYTVTATDADKVRILTFRSCSVA